MFLTNVRRLFSLGVRDSLVEPTFFHIHNGHNEFLERADRRPLMQDR